MQKIAIVLLGMLALAGLARAGPITDVNVEACKNQDSSGSAACVGTSNEDSNNSQVTEEQQTVYATYSADGGDPTNDQEAYQEGNCNGNYIQPIVVIGNGNNVCGNYNEQNAEASSEGGQVTVTNNQF